MHVVVIDDWREETAELAGKLAEALGVTAYEARQRLIGGGPSAVAGFADPGMAADLAARLAGSGVAAEVVDAAAIFGKSGQFVVSRFELGQWSLHVAAEDGRHDEIPFADIDLLLPGTRIRDFTETKTVTERKLSLGKTLLSGGIPMTRKVERHETVTTEERSGVLYVYAGFRRQVLFRQDGMTFEGLGPDMKTSRKENFAFLVAELRRRCPGATFDDRLLTAMGQARLLGPLPRGGNGIHLAAEFLARSLRRRVTRPPG